MYQNPPLNKKSQLSATETHLHLALHSPNRPAYRMVYHSWQSNILPIPRKC